MRKIPRFRRFRHLPDEARAVGLARCDKRYAVTGGIFAGFLRGVFPTYLVLRVGLLLRPRSQILVFLTQVRKTSYQSFSLMPVLRVTYSSFGDWGSKGFLFLARTFRASSSIFDQFPSNNCSSQWRTQQEILGMATLCSEKLN